MAVQAVVWNWPAAQLAAQAVQGALPDAEKVEPATQACASAARGAAASSSAASSAAAAGRRAIGALGNHKNNERPPGELRPPAGGS